MKILYRIFLGIALLALPIAAQARMETLRTVIIEDGEPIHFAPDGSGDTWNLKDEDGRIIGMSMYHLDTMQVLASNATQMAISLDVDYTFKNGVKVKMEGAKMVLAFIDNDIAEAIGLPNSGGDGLISNALEGDVTEVTMNGRPVRVMEGHSYYRSRNETLGGKFFRCVNCLGLLEMVIRR